MRRSAGGISSGRHLRRRARGLATCAAVAMAACAVGLAGPARAASVPAADPLTVPALATMNGGLWGCWAQNGTVYFSPDILNGLTSSNLDFSMSALSNGCSMAGLGGVMWLGYTDASTHQVHLATVRNDGTYSDIGILHAYSYASPAIAVFGSDLFVAYTGTDGHLNVYDNNNSAKTVLTDTSDFAPAIDSGHDGHLTIAWSGHTNDQLNIASLSVNTSTGIVSEACKQNLASQTTGLAPGVTHVGASIYLTWTGKDSGHHVNVLPDGHANDACGFSNASGVLGNGYESATAPGVTGYNNDIEMIWGQNSTNNLLVSPLFNVVNPPIATNVRATAIDGSTIQVTWTDNSGGMAQYRIYDGTGYMTVAPNTVSYTKTGLSPGTYRCFQVQAQYASGGTITGSSPWSAYSCDTTWTDTRAMNDLLTRLNSTPPSPDQPFTPLFSLKDDRQNGMDTAKIIELWQGSYLAVYSWRSIVMLAQSSDLMNWHYLVNLDPYPGGPAPLASQPYLAKDGTGFILADEKLDDAGITQGNSHLFFLHYPDLASLEAGQPDFTFTPQVVHSSGKGSYVSPRFFSACNEGTPDIHDVSADGSSFSVGFHYNSTCSGAGGGLDQEAFGTVIGFTPSGSPSMTAMQDTTRDTAINNIGYGGKHGGRSDIWWHGYRFSLQEAQCGGNGPPGAECQSSNSDGNLANGGNWRYVLYDYSTAQAFPAPVSNELTSTAYCHGNPSVSLITDPSGNQVLVVTGFIFPNPLGCATQEVNDREFLYIAPAQ